MKKTILYLLTITFCGALLFFVFGNRSTVEINEGKEIAQKLNDSQKTVNNHKPEEVNETLNNVESGLARELDTDKEPNLFLNSYYVNNNFYAFVNSNLQRAIDGDNEAQYYLSRALKECEFWVSHRSYKSDEAFEKYLNDDNIYLGSRNSQEVLRDTYNSCKKFVGEDISEMYGSSSEWFKKALDAKYPSAVVDNNINRMVLSQIEEYKTVQNSSESFKDDLVNETLGILKLDEPRALLTMASSPIKLANYSAEETHAAWVILACKNGLPCGKNARWLKMRCSTERGCYDDSNALNMLKGELPNGISRSNELAVKLEEAINNDWSELTPSMRDINR